MPEHQRSTVCAQVGHIITTVLVVRCQHDEGWWCHVDTFDDHGEDLAVTTRSSRRIEAGPFDRTDEIHTQILNALAEGLARQSE